MRIKTRISKLISPLFTLSVLITGVSPALANPITTNMCIKNLTAKAVLFQSSIPYPNDFPTARNPSHSLNNLWLPAQATWCATWDHYDSSAATEFYLAITDPADGSVFDFRMRNAGNGWWAEDKGMSGSTATNLQVTGSCPNRGYSHLQPVPSSYDPSKGCTNSEFRR